MRREGEDVFIILPTDLDPLRRENWKEEFF